MTISARQLLATIILSSCVISGAVAQEKDSSGTNPATMTRQIQVYDEYRFLRGDHYFNIKNFRYTEPFGDTVSLRMSVPVEGTNVLGDDDWGLGDVSAKLSWVAYLSRSNAFILSGELYAPTASNDLFGTGKWVIAPGVTWANFLSPEIIVAPAYIQSLSFAGDDHRDDVNRGDFDLYVVYKPHGKDWWVTSDTTISQDFEHDTTPISWELNFGKQLFKLQDGGVVNGYIRPGVGIGYDRPYNFNIEVGFTVINF